jgi:hypothetical protein
MQTSTIVNENLQWGFDRMPRPVLRAKGLSFRAKAVYNLLLDYCRDKDFCFPAQETMAENLDTSVDTIQRGLQELRDHGLIRWELDGYRKTNVYFLLPLTQTTLPGVTPSAPQQTPQPCAQTPHVCGSVAPQPCGTKTKSKEMHESDEESSKKPLKGRDEVVQDTAVDHHASTPPPPEQTTAANPCPSVSRNPVSTAHADPSTPQRARESKHEALAFGEKARRPQQSFQKAQQKPFVTLEKPLKPLTQDEIDAKKRQGLNASGYTPLPGLIPPDQWQQLEQQARQAPIKPTTTHFHVCTKNAPMLVDATLEEFTALLGDEPTNTAININRAAKLYRQTALPEEAFREKLYEAFDQARRYPSSAIQKKRQDGRPNRMPVFFAILQERLQEPMT